ncbi:MAG TPA: DNA polymerase I [Steroidobacteraceae bacterium]|nr:DNA polymerase I [Steroidobacteraceae bacterium]
MTNPRTLVLVDGSSYLYRAFHALPALSNSRGEPTGAVYGVLNMLLKFMRERAPELVAVVFDARGKTFRDALFAEYKAHRQPMPDDLRSQIDPLLEGVAALGWPLLRIEGVEADDVIGTLACRAAEAGIQVLVSTGDKDMAQLVSESITCVNTMTNSTLDRAGVKAKFDVYPEQIVDYLALIGDNIDNIPGVPKVGPKTAAKWLAEYQTLDNLIASADRVEGKVGESLRANLKTLELSRRLATIDTHLKLDIALTDLAPRPPDVGRLRSLYSRLELKMLLRQLPGALEMSAPPSPGTDEESDSAPPPPAQSSAGRLPPVTPREYDTIATRTDLVRWVEMLRQAHLFALDTESTGSDYMKAELVGMSFAIGPGRAAYLPLAHDYAGAPEQLRRDEALEALRALLEDPQALKLGQHLKFDAHVLANHGIELKGMRFDTMLESYVLNSTARHDLDSNAARYLGIQTTLLENIAGRGARQLAFNQVPVERAAEYAAESADVTLRLHEVVWPKIAQVPSLKRLYEEIEQPLVPVLKRMEERGVLIDRGMLKQQSTQLAKRIQEIAAEAHREAGAPFNLDSPKQLQELLFNRLQLPVRVRTKTGQPSTAEEVLEELAASYSLPRLILEHRALTKLRSTYTDKLCEQIQPRTGRVHTSYHQTVAATGRLSSADPNLQNIPVRTTEGRRIRQAFIAPPGFVIMAADYSQIELRIMAHLSGDEGLLNAFAQDLDIHQATAAEVLNLSLEQVSSQQRRSAKVVNFGLIYGMSAFGLARQLGIERSAAQQYVDRYFQRYPGVKRFMDETRVQARTQGYVETIFGRRLYLNDIRAGNSALRQAAERAAINAPMQGTAADIIKRAMIEVDAWIESERVPAKLIMQVHDELVFEVAAGAAQVIAPRVRAYMAEAAQLRVPLKVAVGIGANWDEAH